MVNRRPSPAQILARKFEIKRRYEHKAKVGKRSRSMAAIRLSHLTRWMHDVYGPGIELEPSERSIEIVRFFAHHMGGLPESSRRITAWLADYAPWVKGADRERLITEVAECPLKWSADVLGWKLRVTIEQRDRLKLTTIGAVGDTKAKRLERRNQAKAERERNRRAAKRQAKAVSTI